MKNLKIILLFAIVMAISFTSCKKDKGVDVNNQIPDDSYSQQIIKKINDFNEKMNSGLKSGETITLDQAVWNKEASLNFTYAHPELLAGDYLVKKTQFTVPVDENNNVLMEDVSSTYTAMEETLNSEYAQIPDSDKNIILSDVKTDSINDGTAFLSLTNIFGISISVKYEAFEVNDDWIWGTLSGDPLAGKCDGTMVDTSDASNELQRRLNHPKEETAYQYGFTDIEIVQVNYENCQYFDPDNTHRIFNSTIQDYCMQNNELTDYLSEYDNVIYTYNDVTNDFGINSINIEDNEGARPSGKAFISMQIIDQYIMYSTIEYYHNLKISYGSPYASPPTD